jgi:hypothetical protein
MIRNYTLSVPGAKVANGQTADITQDDLSPLGAGQFVMNVTAFAGGAAPTITFIIEGLDPTSNTYFPILTSAAIAAASTNVLRVGPGLPVTANVSVNDILPKQFRVRWILAGAPTSVTFSIGVTTA